MPTTQPRKFRKLPVVIEAVQLTWENWSEICDFVGVGEIKWGAVAQGGWVLKDNPVSIEYSEAPPSENYVLGLAIKTLEGLMIGVENDWIIKGVNGEFYPCKPDVFEKTYEKAS